MIKFFESVSKWKKVIDQKVEILSMDGWLHSVVLQLSWPPKLAKMGLKFHFFFLFCFQGALGRSELIYNLELYPYLTDTTASSTLEGGFEPYPDDHLNDGNRAIGPRSSAAVQLFCVSLKLRQGYGSAFRWLAQFLEQSQENKGWLICKCQLIPIR